MLRFFIVANRSISLLTFLLFIPHFLILFLNSQMIYRLVKIRVILLASDDTTHFIPRFIRATWK